MRKDLGNKNSTKKSPKGQNSEKKQSVRKQDYSRKQASAGHNNDAKKIGYIREVAGSHVMYKYHIDERITKQYKTFWKNKFNQQTK